jgi:RHS repeat-associated core domain
MRQSSTPNRPYPAYTPYGHNGVNGQQVALLGFNAEHLNRFLGCYLLGNGYRAYKPSLMRFHSPDCLSPFGRGGLNAYGYCMGDPINLADPSGHAFIKGSLSANLKRTPSADRIPSIAPSLDEQQLIDVNAQLNRLEHVQQDLHQRLQPRPAPSPAEATPYASMESLASSRTGSLVDLPAAAQVTALPSPLERSTSQAELSALANDLRSRLHVARRNSV